MGKHPLQLYSLATPNGVKVTIVLEELSAAGHAGAEYDAWPIRIAERLDLLEWRYSAAPGGPGCATTSTGRNGRRWGMFLGSKPRQVSL